MNSLFENGGCKVFISACIPDLRNGNNIGQIDKKPISSSIHPCSYFDLSMITITLQLQDL